MTGDKTAHTLTARQVALRTLCSLDIKKHDTSRRLNRWLEHTDQHGRATDIVLGVVRNLATIDAVLQKAGDITQKRIQPQALAILRTGAYELLYTPQTAEHAIIYEAVELARSVGSEKSAGFVNAVLRGIQRIIENRCAAIDDCKLQQTIPTRPGYGCLLKEPLLPDKSSQPAQYLSAAFSLPLWLMEQWINLFGIATAQQICFASNRSPAVVAWPNTLLTDAESLLEILCSEGVRVQLSPDNQMLRLSSVGGVEKLDSFQKGLFYIQDPAAAKTVRLLDVGPARLVLDLCAAPGTKTLALAIRMKGKGKIIATDRSAARLDMVEQNRRRLALENIEIVSPDDQNKLQSSKGLFDAVLADVPCSNCGVLARRVEARWRLTEEAITSLAGRQKKLLSEALNYVRSGGSVLYSTCSILPAENRQLIEEVLNERADVCLALEELTLPDVENPDAFDRDGAYAAVLIKK